MNLIFEKDYLASLYSRDQQKRMANIEKLLNNQQDFDTSNPNGLPKSTSLVRHPLQIQKDETILTLLTFAAIHLGANTSWNHLLSSHFLDQWSNTTEPMELKLEKAVSPTEAILQSLQSEASKHPVHYARTISHHDKPIEGPTNFDAVLTTNSKNVFFECKFTSDISHDTTHCTSRNQIARCIDVGLEAVKNKVEDFYFVLVTPNRYKEFPGDRFYYFKMEQYQRDPMAIALDIPRLYDWYESKENHGKLEELTKRIAWLTWEECLDVCLASTELTGSQKAGLQNFYKERLLFEDTEDLPL
ncbi:hypothetical protein [Evansella tamaricis]|uniref:Restriction endonuclease n=1 Tax=Evansella tamaricis TaxID=2069301 RepID=A0ABS6JLP0_9BACI|nr:hypothetical protein [Evansella tamaricis]MBU9714129.1 hypothetical protein [Evansella tamaricis]